jgi:hypothetical protein
MKRNVGEPLEDISQGQTASIGGQYVDVERLAWAAHVYEKREEFLQADNFTYVGRRDRSTDLDDLSDVINCFGFVRCRALFCEI